MRLVHTSKQKGRERLGLLLQTICGTGIRVSELQFITVEAAKRGKAAVACKGKTRSVFIVPALQKKLLRYAAEQKISSGPIFITRSGNPVSRTNIWREMKSLCTEANVRPEKVFPTICGTYSPEFSIALKRTLPSWRTSSATAASIPLASILFLPARSTAKKWSICA